MKFIPHGSHILFLGESGIGTNFGQIAPQIRFFDVFYSLPPVVGFHVIAYGSDATDLAFAALYTP